ISSCETGDLGGAWLRSDRWFLDELRKKGAYRVLALMLGKTAAALDTTVDALVGEDGCSAPGIVAAPSRAGPAPASKSGSLSIGRSAEPVRDPQTIHSRLVASDLPEEAVAGIELVKGVFHEERGVNRGPHYVIPVYIEIYRRVCRLICESSRII